MKKLKLNSTTFNTILQDFTLWLDVLGYSTSTVYNLPNHLREFFFYVEAKGHHGIEHITTQIIKDYYQQLSQRGNERRGGGLSKSFLNKHKQALKKFLEYLNEHHASISFGVHLKMEKSDYPNVNKDIITQDEVKLMFEACSVTHMSEHFQIRDRAILVLLYSCGLRRNEAVHVDTQDILFDKGCIHVRMGKNYKERFVPVNEYNIGLLEEYLCDARPEFLKNYQTDALLLSQIGLRIGSMSMAHRLTAIVEATENEALMTKHITPHTLRHSIATHLMQNEVPIQSISQFLGHSSLESTQIYTHLADQLTAHA